MNCQDAEWLRALYITGDLDQARASELAAHLTHCPGCARNYAESNSLDDQVRRSVLAMDVDSRPIELRIRQAISRKKRSGGSWRQGRAMGSAIAAALILAAGVGMAVRIQTARAANAFFTAAERDHRLEIVERQPRRWLVEPVAMERLAEREGIAASQLSALAPPDYQMVQAKICRLNGQMFLHLVLAHGVKRVSVFLRQSGSRYSLIRSADAAGFGDGQFAALVVADDSATAADIARSVSRVI